MKKVINVEFQVAYLKNAAEAFTKLYAICLKSFTVNLHVCQVSNKGKRSKWAAIQGTRWLDLNFIPAKRLVGKIRKKKVRETFERAFPAPPIRITRGRKQPSRAKFTGQEIGKFDFPASAMKFDLSSSSLFNLITSPLDDLIA